MSVPRPKAPGWYPDPDILPGGKATLRYWNGRHWTDRRRAAPILKNLELGGLIHSPAPRSLEGPTFDGPALEGPARVAELPAPAAEVSAGREGPGGRADTLDRPPTSEVTASDVVGVDVPASTGGGRNLPPQLPGTGGGGSGGSGDGERRPADGSPATRSRRRWWLYASVGVLCALVVTLAGEALRPKSPGPRVITDARFVSAANAACAKTLATLRPTDGGAFGSLVSPTQVAGEIDQAATGLDNLANRLAALPIVASERPYITGWTNDWHAYDTAGRQYAAFLRQHGATSKAPPMLATAAHLAKVADNFALANGLKSCQFTYVDTSNASDM